MCARCCTCQYSIDKDFTSKVRTIWLVLTNFKQVVEGLSWDFMVKWLKFGGLDVLLDLRGVFLCLFSPKMIIHTTMETCRYKMMMGLTWPEHLSFELNENIAQVTSVHRAALRIRCVYVLPSWVSQSTDIQMLMLPVHHTHFSMDKML